jgi:HEAT repeat protein
MKKRTLGYALFAGLLIGGAAVTAYRAHADSSASLPRGTASVYKGIPADQVEQLTPPDRIKSVALTPGAPSRIWQALEHGEKVDCMDCIPAVEGLLYDANAKNREIAAWWLRRRIFGVFGPGEAYERVVTNLVGNDQQPANADPVIRARSAEALGEFLSYAGADPLAAALTKDSSALVRAAAARALDRLNSTGPNNELSLALADKDETVRYAALTAATHIHGFTDVASVAKLVGDSSALVRRHAASALGAMRATDSVTALIALTSSQETDAQTRAEAAHSLGLIGDPAAKPALTAAQNDPDQFVRDAAAIALRRM